MDHLIAPIEVGTARMVRMVRDFDWGATPLGSIEQWPAELKMIVRQILESGFPSAVVWGPGYTTIYNDAFLPILGSKSEALGRSFADVWTEAWDEIGPMAERAYRGEATYMEDFPLVVNRHGHPEQAWFTFCYSPLRLSDGTVAGMIDTVVETTENVRARADLALLNNELSHRLKNTLALIQAIALQTFKDLSEPAIVASLYDRIAALGRAHDLLLKHNWTSASFREVIVETVSPLDGLEQIHIAGPHLEIGSSAAVSLSLVMHELATNAAKYGALSVPDGRVAIAWGISGDVLNLSWRESCGPQVEPPSRSGFGSRLVKRGLGYGGNVRSRFPPSGFELDLDIPVSALKSNER